MSGLSIAILFLYFTVLFPFLTFMYRLVYSELVRILLLVFSANFFSSTFAKHTYLNCSLSCWISFVSFILFIFILYDFKHIFLTRIQDNVDTFWNAKLWDLGHKWLCLGGYELFALKKLKTGFWFWFLVSALISTALINDHFHQFIIHFLTIPHSFFCKDLLQFDI